MPNKPFFILYKFPSRGRPQRFFDSLDTIVNNTVDKDNFHISCTLDLDDESMNNEEVIALINSYPNTSISWGKSTSKIDAVNRDMPSIDFDILVNMSDDMRFNIYGFDEMIRVDMKEFFPNLDGLLHYPDQDAKEWLATMYIAGVNFYKKFGFIYDPKFLSVFCDNLVMDVAQYLRKYKYCGYQINFHLNPAYGHLERDEMFNTQQAHWGHDEAIYNNIKGKGIPEYLKQFNL